MALTHDEQELYDFGRNALPKWLKRDDEFLTAAAKMMGSPRAIVDYLFEQTLITHATGPGAGTPDWLNQHARDRGTSRQAGETDPALQQRLRLIPDALTRQALLDAVNGILAGVGIVGNAALVELPRDAAYLGHFQPLIGTGGTFTQSGTTSTFTPTVLPWPAPPFQAASVAPVVTWQLVIAGAAAGGNNGTRTITGLDDNAAIVTNAAGVAGTDPTVTWTAQRLDVTGNLTDGAGAGRARAYISRGYRTCVLRPTKIVMILPFGTTAGTAAGVREALRIKKAAGVGVIVERRLNP